MVEEDVSTINNDNTPSIIIGQRYGMKDKQDRDVYYKDNKCLSKVVKRSTPFFNHTSERINYNVSEYVIRARICHLNTMLQIKRYRRHKDQIYNRDHKNP